MEYGDEIRNGQKRFVDGGTLIGEIAVDFLEIHFVHESIPQASLSTNPPTYDQISPVPYLRSMPILGGDRWKNHPLIQALSTVEIPVDIYLKFEIWDGAQGYTSLPMGIVVELFAHDPDTSTDHIYSKTLDSNGCVNFLYVDIKNTVEPGYDLYFLTKTEGDDKLVALLSRKIGQP